MVNPPMELIIANIVAISAIFALASLLVVAVQRRNGVWLVSAFAMILVAIFWAGIVTRDGDWSVRWLRWLTPAVRLLLLAFFVFFGAQAWSHSEQAKRLGPLASRKVGAVAFLALGAWLILFLIPDYSGWAYDLEPKVALSPEHDIVFSSRTVRRFGWYLVTFGILIVASVALTATLRWRGIALSALLFTISTVAMLALWWVNIGDVVAAFLREVLGWDFNLPDFATWNPFDFDWSNFGWPTIEFPAWADPATWFQSPEVPEVEPPEIPPYVPPTFPIVWPYIVCIA